MDAQITYTRKYRGYEIQTITQDNGRKTWDIYNTHGAEIDHASESLAVARATVDADIEVIEGWKADWEEKLMAKVAAGLIRA